MDDLLTTTIEAVFRRESGRVIASLLGVSSSFDLAEEAMQDAFSIYKRYPVLGVGMGNYGVVTTVQKTAQNQYPIVNNQYLETLTELGPVGLLLFFVLLIMVMLKLIKMALRKDEVSWYAVAQRYYPASQIANQAIDRLSKTILAKSSL